jgi:flagellar hook-associated protein FlgK
VYKGKYDPPTGAPPVVAMKDTGAFPPGIDEKYQKFKKESDASASRMHNFFNSLPAFAAFPKDQLTGEGVAETMSKLTNSGAFFQKEFQTAMELNKAQKELKEELVKSGYVTS